MEDDSLEAGEDEETVDPADISMSEDAEWRPDTSIPEVMNQSANSLSSI